jgi:hypothetical protein
MKLLKNGCFFLLIEQTHLIWIGQIKIIPEMFAKGVVYFIGDTCAD